MKNKFNNEKLKVLNLGIDIFYDSLKMQQVEVYKIKWKPCANGNKKLLEIIDKLEEKDIH